MAKTQNTQGMPRRRYFIAYPHHPTHWEELNKYEYRSICACLELGSRAEAEGVRVVSLPADMVPVHPSPLPLIGALFTLLTLPYPGGLL